MATSVTCIPGHWDHMKKAVFHRGAHVCGVLVPSLLSQIHRPQWEVGRERSCNRDHNDMQGYFNHSDDDIMNVHVRMSARTHDEVNQEEEFFAQRLVDNDI